MSTKSDSESSENNDKVGDTCPSTSRGESSGSMRKNQKGSEVELRTDNELGRVIAAQNKGGSKIVKDNMANKENNSVITKTGNVNNTSKTSDCRAKETRSDGSTRYENAILPTVGASDNCNDVFGAAFDKNAKNINNPFDTNIVKDNECTSVDTGIQPVQLKDCANRQEIQLCSSTVRNNHLTDEDQDCENQQKEHDDVLRSVQKNMPNVNHEQEKYAEISDLHVIEDITKVTGINSNDQSNSSATGNTITDFQKNCLNASHNNNKDTANIRYGKTPNNEKTSK